jgi:protein involved in polysaccharide export with SLBB domain
LLLSVFLSTAALPVSAQDVIPGQSPVLQSEPSLSIGGSSRAPFGTPPSATLNPSVKPVNPEEYVVGSGDGLVINFWGGVDLSHDVFVSADGKIVVPTIGTLEVRGKTLVEVEELVRSEARKYYRMAKASVTLSRLRSFEVSVVGEVARPGIYLATPVTRLSEILQTAGGPLPGGSVRHLEIQRSGREPLRADLIRFFEEGDLTQNPFLSDGDVVHIPAVTQNRNVVKVKFREFLRIESTGKLSEVETAKVLELREGEAVRDVLQRIGGLSPWFDLERAYVERFHANPGEREVIPVNLHKLLVENDATSNIPLQNGDILTIPAVENNVYVIGRVKNAGPFPFVPHRRPADYIGMAGGPDDRAKLSDVIVHRGDAVLQAGKDLVVQPGDTIEVPERAVKWWQDYLTILMGLTSVIISYAVLI